VLGLRRISSDHDQSTPQGTSTSVLFLNFAYLPPIYSCFFQLSSNLTFIPALAAAGTFFSFGRQIPHTKFEKSQDFLTTRSLPLTLFPRVCLRPLATHPRTSVAILISTHTAFVSHDNSFSSSLYLVLWTLYQLITSHLDLPLATFQLTFLSTLNTAETQQPYPALSIGRSVSYVDLRHLIAAARCI
jgi:hypothetical protein